MKIFFSAGEPSGDLHAANLIRQLRRRAPDVEIVGYGGPKMAEAGCQLHEDLTRLAVMWFLRALLNLHTFWNLVGRADRYFRHHKPDAVVLVDFPGFNWWIARRAKRHGIPVFYYAPPQVWAWARWRVKKMRRLVDYVLCGLPFEAQWYREQGCNAHFVGHPFFDELAEHRLDQGFVDAQSRRGGRLVTLLPGSRTQEVTHNLRWLLKAAAIVHRAVPEARFALAAFKPTQADLAHTIIAQAGPGTPPIDVHVGRTPELIRAAESCLAVSGSVSLELLYHARPTVVLYWITPLAYRVQEYFRKVKYITLVNLLAAKEVFPEDLTPYDPGQPDADEVPFPEYLTCRDKSEAMAAHVVEWLTDEAARQRRIAALEQLKRRVAHGGASSAAAELILDDLAARRRRRAHDRVPRPHFLPRAEPSRTEPSRTEPARQPT